MLKYSGTDMYEFHTERNEMVTLSKADVNTMCELAMEDSEFDIGKKMEELADKSEHWQELYAELVKHKEELHNDIMDFVRKHKVKDA